MVIDYIRDRFHNSYFSDECKTILKDVTKISGARNHKPFNENSGEYKDFFKKQLAVVERLRSQYSYVRLDDDYNFFTEKLTTG